MLKLCRVTLARVKVFFLVLYAFDFDLFKFSAAILEKGLLHVLIFYPAFLTVCPSALSIKAF